MKKLPHEQSAISHFLAVLTCCSVVGCAGPVYTTDDGSKVDEKLLSAIRLYGRGERAIRPRIVQSSLLKDPDCSKQWELPFAVASSYDLPHMEKIAWVRGLQVDERLTIIAAAPGTGLQPGDKIAKINGRAKDADVLLEKLIGLREDGDEFELTLSDKRLVKVKPVEVCRGRVEITKPASPLEQDYHWLKTTHSMSLFNQELTADEAMWVVLWTQGLSEEAGARMKTYHYGLKVVKTTATVVSIASGVGAVATAAQTAAANIAASEAGKAAAQAAAKEVAKYAADQVADSIRQKMIDAAVKETGKAAAQDVAMRAANAAGLFKSGLSGISWAAGTGFWMADKWALDRMTKLGADPVAGYSLHYKLASHEQLDNAFLLDEERLEKMKQYAEAGGFAEKANYVLAGSPSLTQATAITISSVVNIEARPLESLAPLGAQSTAVALSSVANMEVRPLASLAPLDGAPSEISSNGLSTAGPSDADSAAAKPAPATTAQE